MKYLKDLFQCNIFAVPSLSVMNSVLCNKNFAGFKNHFRKGWSKAVYLSSSMIKSTHRDTSGKNERSISWWHGYVRVAYRWICAFIDFYNCHFVKKILYCCPWVPQLKTVFNRTMLVALCTIWCLFKYLNIYSFLLCMWYVYSYRSLCCFAVF